MRTPSPATVIATLALVVATTGTSIAATKINGQSIKNHTITANKLAKGAVTARAVAPRAITPLALADGVIVNNTINAPAGPKGDTGAAGANGVAFVDPAKIITINGLDVTVSQNSTAHSDAICPDGTYVIGGGYNEMQSNPPAQVVPTASKAVAINGNQGWSVVARNLGGFDQAASWHAIAYCAPAA